MFSSLKLYVVAAGAIASCLLLWRLHHVTGQRDAAEAALAIARGANQSNQTTIATQQRALGEWRALQVTPQEAAIAVALHEQLKASVLSLSEQLRKAKEQDRAKPACKALLETDVGAVCPAVSRELRRLSTPNQK